MTISKTSSIDRRAISESKKPEHAGRFVVAMKTWGRYVFIVRNTARDAKNTHAAAQGYKTAVARDGILIHASNEALRLR